ncbi:MAG TPA: ABC transporter ATP-binding protein [Casimicrobiaceae bacterium]|nr:ABC transporter ATP-binding protein [Casimicrobiaceae bacterium]
MQAAVRLEHVTKRYGQHLAVDDISLEIEAGRFVTLLGPSGSGKTTLLMMMAGFVQPTRGAIYAGTRDITSVAPEHRDFGMVFQGYALFPNMTVAQNIAFALRLRKLDKAVIAREVDRMLDTVRLTSLGGRLPRELSGGQQQRVALARALIFKPKVLLLDEPLSALDKKLRAGLQEELRDLHERVGTTFIFVTHDQDEALSMSDEVVIINRGRIVQRGGPKDLYDRPASHFVADFLGRSNFIEGRIAAIDRRSIACSAGSYHFNQAASSPSAGRVGDTILIGLRPEKVVVSASEPDGDDNRVRGEVTKTTYEGADYHVRVATDIGPMQAVVPAWRRDFEPQPGSVVWLSWPGDASVVLRDDR